MWESLVTLILIITSPIWISCALVMLGLAMWLLSYLVYLLMYAPVSLIQIIDNKIRRWKNTRLK
jgi:hypothetical protein